MAAISRLRGISPEEEGILRSAGFETTEKLWEELGKDRGGVFLKLGNAGLSYDRMRAVVSAAADVSTWRSRVAKHVPDALVAFLALGLLALTLRAAGGLNRLPAPWGLPDKVAIAGQDLAANHVLQQGDLHMASLPRGTTSFTSTDLLQGLVTAHAVSRLQPLRFADVLRLQVVATTDITSGATLTTGAVTLRWSPFSPPAELAVGPVVGHHTLRALYSGSVVTRDAIGP